MRPSEFIGDGWQDLPWEEFRTHTRQLRRTVPDGLLYARRRRPWLNDARMLLLNERGSFCADCQREYVALIREWEMDRSQRFPLFVDHIVPLGLNGDHAVSNFQLLCRICHDRKTRDIDLPQIKATWDQGIVH